MGTVLKCLDVRLDPGLVFLMLRSHFRFPSDSGSISAGVRSSLAISHDSGVKTMRQLGEFVLAALEF